MCKTKNNMNTVEVQKKQMYRVKVTVYFDNAHIGRWSETKKTYFRDEEAANKAVEEVKAAILKTMAGEVDIFEFGNSAYKANLVSGYKITVRKPAKPEELPDKIEDEDED